MKMVISRLIIRYAPAKIVLFAEPKNLRNFIWINTAGMKKVLSAVMLFLAFCLALSAETVKGSDGKITYIGRTMVKDGSVSFDWTGVYATVRFQGSILSFKVSDTNANYYNVWIDSPMGEKADKVVRVHGKDTTIVLYNVKDRKASRSPHQVIIQKRTEGSQGRTTIHEFTTDGQFLQADPKKERLIEFIGDSYTCGYGTEATNKDHFSPETENQNLTYACETARYFGADQIVLAHSGMGVTRNYNGNLTGSHMPEHYQRTFDQDDQIPWDAKSSSLNPDITVIYLGTNDFSTRMQPAERVFVKEYSRLIGEVKDNYGKEHPILCIAPKHDPLMETYIRKAIDTSGYENLHFLGLSKSIHNEESDMGADGHPNYSGHTKIAYTVIPCISTIMGWELSGNEIK